MKLGRYKFAALAAILTFAAPAMANADDTARIVIPFPAGGISDSIARIVADRLGTELDETVIVEPHPGGSGLVASRHVINAPADGTTLFLASPTIMMILPRTMTLEFDPMETFVPVSNVGSSPMLFAVRKDLPVESLDEFVTYARELPENELTIASGGAGTSTHLIPSLFFNRAGLELTHVPYKGGAPALQDLLAGHVDAYFGNPSEIAPHDGGDDIRILATSGETRMPALPDVPSVNESFDGVSLVTWNGLFFKAGVSEERIQQVSEALQRIAQDPDYVSAISKLGVTPIGDSSEDFAAFIADAKPKWDEAIDASGIGQQ